MQSGIARQLWAWPGAFPRIFSTLGWVLAAALLYVHAFGFVVNHARAYLPPRDSPLSVLFLVCLQTSFLAPVWVFAAILLALIAAGLGKRPGIADAAVFLFVLGLAGLYVYLGFQD